MIKTINKSMYFKGLYEKIRNILELLRISNSLSQRQLGTCLGISKSKIHDLES